jgi:hypothetical protein
MEIRATFPAATVRLFPISNEPYQKYFWYDSICRTSTSLSVTNVR